MLRAGEVEGGSLRSQSGKGLLLFHGSKVVATSGIEGGCFDKEKEKIRNQLFEAAFQKNFKAWIESRREDSFVRVNAL